MGEEKKTTSFLYNLYQKYKESIGAPQTSSDLSAGVTAPKAETTAADAADAAAAASAATSTAATDAAATSTAATAAADVSTAAVSTAATSTDAADAADVSTAAAPEVLAAERQAEPAPADDYDREEEKRLEPLKPLSKLYFSWAKNSPSRPPRGNLPAFEKLMMAPIAELTSHSQYKDEIAKFIHKLSGSAKSVADRITVNEEAYTLQMNQYRSALQAAGPEDPNPVKPQEPPAVDASVHICLIEGRMQALLLVFPPCRGGKKMDSDTLALALKNNHIVYGINKAMIDDMIRQQAYLQIFPVARGDYMTPGKPGEILHLIDCNNKVKIQEDGQGNVDFKNLNIICTVMQEDVICELIPPEEGICGKDVCGNAILPPLYKVPEFPMGKNTKLSEDGLKLVSALDGCITLQNKRYQVDPVLVIKGNVDYSIGNLDFPGDVIINGDVCNGFQVKAQGNIMVRGMVECACVSAGKDISIQKGMNGNQTGTIHAGGSVTSSFLENCMVFSGGSITAGSIVSCNIFCDDRVFVQGPKGVIIGGSITAYRSVEARMIGSKSRRATSITLGEMPDLLKKKNAIQTKLNEINTTIDKLSVNINYLEKFKSSLPEDKQIIFTQLVDQKTLYLDQKKELKVSLAHLENDNADFSDCFVKSNMIFPITKISIDSENFIVAETVLSKCNFFFAGGMIQQGVF